MPNSATRTKRTRIVTFSGIDGAGKTTQIESLRSSLHRLGFQSKLYTFWDHVVAFSRLREHASRAAFGGDSGIGSPEKPISRRDKNVQTWYAIAPRLGFYLMDALSLRRTWRKIQKEGADVAVFDRYLYDELANLPLRSGLIRLYVRALLRLAPRPDTAFLIDADPEAARLRKPEYPLAFLRENREAYLALSRLIPAMVTIEAGSVEEVGNRIEATSLSALSARPSTVSPALEPLVLARKGICPSGESPR
jgi:thymidylate kinase